jgi:hypothetical protein
LYICAARVVQGNGYSGAPILFLTARRGISFDPAEIRGMIE